MPGRSATKELAPAVSAVLVRPGVGPGVELAEPFAISLAAVSKHLAVLERAGLVRRRRDGRTHYCSLRPEALTDALDWISIYQQFWVQRFDSLAATLAIDTEKES